MPNMRSFVFEEEPGPVVELDDETPPRIIHPRAREETAPRKHAFLPQTRLPADPMVREMERRRSGRKAD